jgi:tetratricopeptide (TPR) repeat protein
MLKDSQGALEDFRAAIKLSPYSAHMYMNRGNLYASTQQYDMAEKDFTKGNICPYIWSFQ